MYYDANNTTSHITINSKFDVSKITLKIGRLSNAGLDTGFTTDTCTIEFLDEAGKSIGNVALEAFVSAEEFTIDNIPAGCKSLKIHNVTSSNNNYFLLYSFTLTFTD